MSRCLMVGAMLSLSLGTTLWAGGSARAYNLKVISENVPDVSSVDALLRQIIKPGMSDEQKCSAVWRVVYEHRFWRPASCGWYPWGGTDPILNLNCFAPTICQQDSEMLCGLWSMLGYDVRLWQLNWHTTSEVFYGGRWRHFDATMGVISRDSAEEITSVTERHKREGYKKRTRDESFVSHTDGYVLGHSMGLTLRRGESFTRYWRPLSKAPDYWTPGYNGRRPEDGFSKGKSRLRKSMALKPRRFEPLPTDAAYANGLWVFEPDLSIDGWQDLLEDRRNITVRMKDDRPRLGPAKTAQNSWATFRVRSPYIITGGWLSGRASRGSEKDRVAIAASADGGATWKELWTHDEAGVRDFRVALREVVCGKLDYLLRFEMRAGPIAADVALQDLRIETVVQVNPFLLPALRLGETAIEVSAGEQLETVSLIPDLNSPEYRAMIVEEQNVVTAREGNHEKWVRGICARTPGRESYLVFKVQTPGPMKRLRWGGRFERAGGQSKLYYSFDGKSWKEKPWSFEHALKETRNKHRASVANYEAIRTFPKDLNTVWVKFWFLKEAPVKEHCHLHLMTGLRIDADYLQAGADLPPVPCEVIYCWEEIHDERREKTHTEKVASYPHRYKVRVAGTEEPVMKWVRMQLSESREESRR